MAFKRIKDWLTSITAFRTGDVIPVDGPSGTAKMSKDNLLAETAENALAGNVATAFDPTKANDSDGYAYHVDDIVVYDGKVYVITKNKTSGSWDASYASIVDLNTQYLREKLKYAINENDYANQELLPGGIKINGEYNPAVASSYSSTPLIEVHEGWKVTYNGGGVSSSYSALFGYADKSESSPVELLAFNNVNLLNKVITIPSGVKFIRASFRIGNANAWHLKIDSLASKILSNELNTTKNTLDLEKVLSSGNPFDTATQNKFISSNGTIATISDPTLCTTDYCRVFEGMSLHYIGGYQVTSSFIAVCGYADENGSSPVTLIAFDKAGTIDKTIVIPSGVNFVRACNRSSVVASPSLTLGTLESRIDNLENVSKKTIISVKQDGTGDYTSVMDAINASSGASSTNVYEIDVYEGVYDMIDEFFGESDYTDSPYKGPTLPNYVNLVGKGRRENIVLQAIFPNTIKYRTSQMFSTMNAPHNNVIENITFKAFNCRYPFHCQVDTGDVDYGRKRVVKNCVFIHLGYDEGATGTTAPVTNENNNTTTRWSSCHPYGQGTTAGCVSEFVDCDFICDAVTGSAFLTHDRQDVAFEDASVCFESCRFEISKTGNVGPVVALSSLDGEQDTPVTFKGCLFSSVSGSKAVSVSISSSNTSGGCGYWLYGYGNDLNGLTVNMAVGYDDQNRMLL